MSRPQAIGLTRRIRRGKGDFPRSGLPRYGEPRIGNSPRGASLFVQIRRGPHYRYRIRRVLSQSIVDRRDKALPVSRRGLASIADVEPADDVVDFVPNIRSKRFAASRHQHVRRRAGSDC
jgi:hypothetical protein